MNEHSSEIADNRKLWDAWTAIHTAGGFYDVQRFRDDPNDVRIEAWERDEVGDVTGKTLLHLQCHFGLDTLSWARLGASNVTGVDFSEPAIAFANEPSRRMPPRVSARPTEKPRMSMRTSFALWNMGCHPRVVWALESIGWSCC